MAKVVSVVRAGEGEVMVDLERERGQDLIREVAPESLDRTSSAAMSAMTKPATLALPVPCSMMPMPSPANASFAIIMGCHSVHRQE